MGFPVDKFEQGMSVFLWAIVALQRRMVLGYKLPDDDIGCWLQQYGGHLVERSQWTNPQPVRFTYDATKLADYKSKGYLRYTFRIITGWTTLNPNIGANGVWIGTHATRWDAAMNAQIEYQRNKTVEKWDAFRLKMEAARKLPFA